SVDDGGLARAVGADQADDLPGAHLERDVGRGRDRAVGDADIADREHGFGVLARRDGGRDDGFRVGGGVGAAAGRPRDAGQFARDAVGIGHDGDDEQHTADDRVVVAEVQEPVDQQVHDAAGGHDPGQDAAGDGGDAGDVDDGEQGDAEED